MNKQIFRRVSLIIFSLIIIGVATYFVVTSNTKEAKAYVSIDSAVDLFAPYATWPNSAVKKAGTAAEWLHQMTPNRISEQWVDTLDINGDGLVDILIHRDTDPIPPSGSIHHWYGILLNRGDQTFDFTYKCVIKYTDSVPLFYGDCAQ